MVLAIILSGMSWLMIRNYETINILNSQGRNPVSIVTLGDPGKDGASAYDIAVKNGYKGSEQDWLATFRGQDGQDGLSAYQVAVQNGYNGTVGDWLLSLVGPKGSSAYRIAVDNGYTGNKQDWLASLVGPQGQKGDTGQSGPQGTPGSDGIDGRTPVFSCVIRWDTSQAGVTRYWFAQKYEGEPDTAYVNKYRLSSDQAASSTGTACIDLRTK